MGNENLMGKGKDGKAKEKRKGNEVWSGWWCIVDAQSLLEESKLFLGKLEPTDEKLAILVDDEGFL